MLLSSYLPAAVMLEWCRTLHHGYDIGLPPTRLFRQLAKSGPRRGRPHAARLAARLKKGNSLTDALAPEADAFPTHFLEMVAIGEETGRLTDIWSDLERYFTAVAAARRQFHAGLVYPGITYVCAIAVIALMIWLLGVLAPPGGPTLDPTGLGLAGPVGAILFLGAAGTLTLAIVLGFLFVRDHPTLRPVLESYGMRLPGVSNCLRAFALQRFSMTMSAAEEAGLRADRALAAAFRATANQHYQRHAATAARRAETGMAIPRVLEHVGPPLFPDEYLAAVTVGDTSGQLAEVLEKQAAHYHEEGIRRLQLLSRIAAGAIYAIVALLVILAIVRIMLSIMGVYQQVGG